MRHLSHLVVLSATILSGICAENLSRGETDADNKQSEQTIVGTWRADAVSMSLEKGKKVSFPSLFDNSVFSVGISADKLTIWEGKQKLAEMSYVLDSKQTPCKIESKFLDRDMLGIYILKSDYLKIGLRDAKKGQPTDYYKTDYDIVLVLHRFQGQPLMVIDVDDGKSHSLMSIPEYTTCGSPNWSHDGSKIAFDAWRSLFGEAYTSSHVFVVNADGSEPKDLGDGALPSFSPDGKRIAYARYDQNAGVWMMNADGSDKHSIDSGNFFCARWSPKGDYLVYGSEDNKNIYIRDLNSNERRALLEKKYNQIYWGFCWSPDAKWICFKGDVENGGSEVALVSAEGQAKGFKVLLPSETIPNVGNIQSTFSWTPDGKKIIISTIRDGNGNWQLYFLDPESKTLLEKLAGQNPNNSNYFSSWSPDGKKVVIAFWPGSQTENNGQSGGLLNRIFGF